MGKLFGFHTMGVMLKALSDACFKADEQERNGEKVTACGMSDEEINDLCENYLPYVLNPMMSTEEVKEKLHVSDATLNRMVARGDIPNGECKKRGHTRYWKKWDILHFLKNRKKCFSKASVSNIFHKGRQVIASPFLSNACKIGKFI